MNDFRNEHTTTCPGLADLNVLSCIPLDRFPTVAFQVWPHFFSRLCVYDKLFIFYKCVFSSIILDKKKNSQLKTFSLSDDFGPDVEWANIEKKLIPITGFRRYIFWEKTYIYQIIPIYPIPDFCTVSPVFPLVNFPLVDGDLNRSSRRKNPTNICRRRVNPANQRRSRDLIRVVFWLVRFWKYLYWKIY